MASTCQGNKFFQRGCSIWKSYNIFRYTIKKCQFPTGIFLTLCSVSCQNYNQKYYNLIIGHSEKVKTLKDPYSQSLKECM